MTAQELFSFMRDTATYYRRLSSTAAKTERVAEPTASAPAGTATCLGPPAHERPAMAGSYCRRDAESQNTAEPGPRDRAFCDLSNMIN
jgi:hypothetical protein